MIKGGSDYKKFRRLAITQNVAYCYLFARYFLNLCWAGERETLTFSCNVTSRTRMVLYTIVMFENIFPLGVSHYLVGGLLVGVGIAIPFIFTGLVVGVSSFYTAAWSYVLNGWFFRSSWYLESRGWKWFLVAGLVSGGLLYWFFYGPAEVSALSWDRLLIGGTLVGIGTRMAGGCTSGHGICGLASLEKVSLVATVIFVSTAIIVALLTKAIFI